MASPERVLYISGVGDEPLIQERLPELWKPYGLQVVRTSIDATKNDYETRIEEVGELIQELAEDGQIDIVGASDGGVTGMVLYARNSDLVRSLTTISTKMELYDLQPETRDQYPNLVKSSAAQQAELPNITPFMRRTMLCLRGLKDKRVSPQKAWLPGAHDHTLFAFSHRAAIERALTVESYHIAFGLGRSKFYPCYPKVFLYN